MPHLNELAQKYKDDLVIIGMCAQRGAETMAETAKEWGITYPVAKDVEDKTRITYGGDSFPDYFIIDREGRVVVADCKNGEVDRVLAMLLDD